MTTSAGNQAEDSMHGNPSPGRPSNPEQAGQGQQQPNIPATMQELQRWRGFEALRTVEEQLISEETTERDWQYIADFIKPLNPDHRNTWDIMRIMLANGMTKREFSDWNEGILPKLLTAWGLGAIAENPSQEIALESRASCNERRIAKTKALKNIVVPSATFEQDIALWWIRLRKRVAKGAGSTYRSNQAETTTTP